MSEVLGITEERELELTDVGEAARNLHFWLRQATVAAAGPNPRGVDLHWATHGSLASLAVLMDQLGSSAFFDLREQLPLEDRYRVRAASALMRELQPYTYSEWYEPDFWEKVYKNVAATFEPTWEPETTQEIIGKWGALVAGSDADLMLRAVEDVRESLT